MKKNNILQKIRRSIIIYLITIRYSPGIRFAETLIIIPLRKIIAIQKAKYRAFVFGKTQYVLPFKGGSHFMVIDTCQESMLRKKKKTKRWKFKQLIAGCIYTAVPK